MQGYFDLILGQLAHWRDNATNLYGARGFLAPPRTDGEYGHMLHFNNMQAASWPSNTVSGRLTQLGLSLEGPLSALRVWAETHMPEIDRDNQRADASPPAATVSSTGPPRP